MNAGASATPRKSRGLKQGMIIALAIAVVGIVVWGYQIASGLYVTGMRNFNSWGLYITMFMFFVGLSAGGLIISSAPKVFGLQGFGGISKIAVYTSIVCTVLAIGFVIIDLGHPDRVLNMLVSLNISSPLAWDMIVLTAYLTLSIIYLVFLIKKEKGEVTDRTLKIISVAAFLVAILVHSVTAWIFGLQNARPFWNTALLAPWFVSSALVSGLALVLVVVLGMRKAGFIAVESESVTKMACLLAIFIFVDLFLFFCDLLTAGYAASGSEFDLVMSMLGGNLAPFFWIEVGGGIVAALVLLTPALRARGGLVAVAAILAIVGILMKRMQLILGGFGMVNIEYPTLDVFGVPLSASDGVWQSLGAALPYWPTGIEVCVTIGVLALGVGLFFAGVAYLPLVDAKTVER